MTQQKSADVAAASDQAIPVAQLKTRLAHLPGWALDGAVIRRDWSFKDYYQTLAFVNAVAWIAHHTDHHPDMQVGYNRVSVAYSTHSSGGISEKDLICAAIVSALDG